MKLPLVAFVGRANVGKSTLFNRFLRKKKSLVANRPGVTRDRIFGDAMLEDRLVRMVDSGGLELTSKETMEAAVTVQARLAVEESDLVVFVVHDA